MRIQSIADSKPIAGAEVSLCRKLDPDCEVSEARSSTDANGAATLQVPGGFNGFVRAIKPEPSLPAEQQLLPTYYFFNPSIDGDLNVTLSGVTGALLRTLTLLVEVPYTVERGLILVNALNCQLQPAAGVAIAADTADPLITPFYVVGGVPNATSSSTGSDGFGGFANVNSGIVTITGEIVATGREIGSVTVYVRPNSLTQTRLVPTGS